ncbi:penicillin-binding protein 2 [bacterium]|nr:penicillin-binding protein 2 [bacterium]
MGLDFKDKNKIVLYAFILGFVLLGLKLFYLQVSKYEYYNKLSQENRIRMVNIKATRGEILDRNGNPLVLNYPTYTVSLLPFEFSPTEEVVSSLAELLELDEDYIIERFFKYHDKQYSPIPIKRKVDFETISILEENNLDYPGVLHEVDPIRVYPYNKMACHLIGYTGEISVGELRERYVEGLKAGDWVGKQGVEKHMDNTLRGRDGYKLLEVKVTGEVVGQVEGTDEIDAQPGADLWLTIDTHLQMVAESVFAHVERGALIAMDPRNGEILAMVSKPDYDLNIFSSLISDTIWERLSSEETHPMLNRCVQGTYPPASIFKIITASAAIDKGYITSDSKLQPCYGSIWYGDRYFRCWKSSGHFQLNLIQAIAQSCDIYFYQLGLRLGLDEWVEYTNKCMFGQKTGIEITPEMSGFIPNRDYYNSRYGRRGWGYGVVFNLAIGQGEILVTPIQLAQFISATANGGRIFKPQLVKKIVPVYDSPKISKPLLVGTLPFSQQALQAVRLGMIEAVNGEMGTGKGAYMEGHLVAGKTGTAQVPHGQVSHALFAAFAPAYDPEVVVIIILENAGSGSAIAYLVRQFMEYYFQQRKIEYATF